MQAIITKIIPATDTKPTRIKATAARGSVTMGADAICGEWTWADSRTHSKAARILCDKFCKEDKARYGSGERNPWLGKFVTGCLPSGDFAHVFVD